MIALIFRSVFLALTFLLSACGTAAYRAAVASQTDGKHIEKLGLSKGEAKLQAPCAVALAGKAPISCAVVETEDSIFFLRYVKPSRSYEPFLHFKSGEISGIALAKFGFNRQVQLKIGDHFLAFQAIGAEFIDATTTKSVHDNLVAAGVPVMEPQSWINLETTPVVIPIYVP